VRDGILVPQPTVQEIVRIERQRPHLHRAVGEYVPLVARAVVIQLEAVAAYVRGTRSAIERRDAASHRSSWNRMAV
jgi:hypothetical protein